MYHYAQLSCSFNYDSQGGTGQGWGINVKTEHLGHRGGWSDSLKWFTHSWATLHAGHVWSKQDLFSLQQNPGVLRLLICTFFPSLKALYSLFLQHKSGSAVGTRIFASYLVNQLWVEYWQFCWVLSKPRLSSPCGLGEGQNHPPKWRRHL